MLRYVPILAVLGLIIYCLFDVLARDRREFQSLNKFLWFLVVLLPIIGAVLWLTLGRPRRAPTGSAEHVIHLRRKERPMAPDDDPEFLRVLDERAWRAKREAMQHGEAAQETADGEQSATIPDQEGEPSSDDGGADEPPPLDGRPATGSE